MTEMSLTTRPEVDRLQAGDAVEITHEVKVGSQVWSTATRGIVLSVERRRHGLHFRRNRDDKVYSDLVKLKQVDGATTTLTIDEFTRIRRLG